MDGVFLDLRPSDLQARGFNSCGRSAMYCRSDGHFKNSILVHLTYFKLTLKDTLVGLIGLFRRSGGHFS